MLILVRDPRFGIGGLESWVEALCRGLPPHGINTTVLVPSSNESLSSWKTRLHPAKVMFIDLNEDISLQVRSVLLALEALAHRRHRGVFFTMSYPYINVAGINLSGSPWLPIP